MKRLEFRPAARADLASIARYTVRRWGKAQAVRYLDAINDAAQQLASGQLKGHPTIFHALDVRRVGAHASTTARPITRL